MRVRHIIERYRDFAARAHLAMAALAAGLVAAIIVLMIVSAVPSRAAGFLAAEARNIVTMAPTSDMLLALTVALVFLAVLVAKILDRRTPTE